tara:strand:- start:4978 stop:5691 length:714 start_codon:yes stop_codon:yes gene_type:complete
MTVGMISAIPEEYSKIKWDDTPKTETVMNKEFQIGKINGTSIVAGECGIGKVNAAITSTVLLTHYNCDSIIFSGVAGGLNPRHKIGDIIIGSKLIQHDYGSIVDQQVYSSLPGCFPSLEDNDDPISYEMSSEMEAFLQSHVGSVATFGTIITGDTYLSCSETRKMFHQQFDADAIEMEGGAIAQVCCQTNKPFVIVRVLSDLAGDHSHIDFDKFIDDSAASAARVVSHLIPILDAWE